MNAKTVTPGNSAQVDSWMAGRLEGVEGSARFDVLAPDAPTGAKVAMYLRTALLDATVLSAPDSRASGERSNPHVLTCSAWMPGHSERQTREALIEAFDGMDTTTPGPHLVFEREPGEPVAA